MPVALLGTISYVPAAVVEAAPELVRSTPETLSLPYIVLVENSVPAKVKVSP